MLTCIHCYYYASVLSVLCTIRPNPVHALVLLLLWVVPLLPRTTHAHNGVKQAGRHAIIFCNPLLGGGGGGGGVAVQKQVSYTCSYSCLSM